MKFRGEMEKEDSVKHVYRFERILAPSCTLQRIHTLILNPLSFQPALTVFFKRNERIKFLQISIKKKVFFEHGGQKMTKKKRKNKLSQNKELKVDTIIIIWSGKKSRIAQ